MTTYKLTAAIALLAKHGFVKVSVSRCKLDINPTVTLHQDWEANGKDKAVIRLARGKYKGENIGAAWRE